MNDTNDDLFLSCIKISNAYRNKHKELQQVFKAYKNLSNNCDDSQLNLKLSELSQNLNAKPVISKTKLKLMIDEQNKIASELNQINKEVSKMYPNIYE